jgi:lysosomal acid lipase/cholesteryl ester hydrolase
MEDYEDEYGWEPYPVETEDGYELTVFKVFKRDYTGPTESVLFQQGYGQDATSTLEAMNEYWPGEKHHWFKAIDEGYDVWFNNFRGTRYSLGHTSRNNTSREYWDFSFPELGIYDTPAAIDKI